jgi:hypothetical protein
MLRMYILFFRSPVVFYCLHENFISRNVVFKKLFFLTIAGRLAGSESVKFTHGSKDLVPDPYKPFGSETLVKIFLHSKPLSTKSKT